MTTPVTSTSAGNSSTAAAINNSLASLASNSQTFLTLLTTQLKNKDPTNPLDTNQFTSKLTQMTGVEQQVLANQLLQQLVSQSAGAGVPGAVGLIGKSVTANGDKAILQNSAATWGFNLEGQATDVTVQVSDSSGNLVYSGKVPGGTGAQTFTWNGKTLAGQQEADGGAYTLSVSAADSAGNAVTVSNQLTGTATAIQQVAGQTMVTIGGVQVPLNSITGVTNAS